MGHRFEMQPQDAKLPAAALSAKLADKALLAIILTHHVIGRAVPPEPVGKGPFASMDGAPITTSGSGPGPTVNGTAHIVCGDIGTANATVYLIDTVLLPPSA